MRKKIVAGNWKMNMNLQEGVALAKELNEALAAEKPNCDVVVCTPFIHLATVAGILDANTIGLGAENCADKEKGAFTGEVSAEMVKSTGAQYVILGHSERREYYNETPEILKEKVLLALKNGLKVIFCIGESKDQREANKQNEVVKAELEGIFFDDKNFKNLFVTVLSFGFKYGIPADADLVFDVRFLPNPYYIEELKHLTGNDKPVQDYVKKAPETTEFLEKIDDLLKFLLPNYVKEGKNSLVIAIGCTGGKHRSVTLANEIYKLISRTEYGCKVEHRDIEKDSKRKG